MSEAYVVKGKDATATLAGGNHYDSAAAGSKKL